MIDAARAAWRLLRGQPRCDTHAGRLQAFYAPQATHYDAWRENLLHGRRELLAELDPQPGSRIVELGGGTGRNLLYFGDRLDGFAAVTLVDLCPALLERARTRWADRPNVDIVEADASTWKPPAPVDCAYFSYALTMMPGWQAAIDNAIAMLKPGGRLGVVDFHDPHPRPAAGLDLHAAASRGFWRRWFGHQGVRLDPAHLDYLRERLPRHTLVEARAGLPYLPVLRVPHYRFVGQLPGRAVG